MERQARRKKRRKVGAKVVITRAKPTIPQGSRDPLRRRRARPCAPYGAGAGSTPRRSSCHSQGLRKQRLRVSSVPCLVKSRGAARLTLLARVAVHVGLERARAREALVAHLALVLLLRAARDLGVEGAHHGLRRRRQVRVQEGGRARQGARAHAVDRLGGRAVVGDGAAVDGAAAAEVARVPAGRGDGGAGGVRGREAVGVGRAAVAARAVDVARRDVGLAHGHHAAGAVHGLSKRRLGIGKRHRHSRKISTTLRDWSVARDTYGGDIRRADWSCC